MTLQPDLTGMNLDGGNTLWRLLPPQVLAQGQVLQVLLKINLCCVVESLLPNACLH